MGNKLGKYEIIEEIGKGGFATVYKAKDTTLERIAALKVLRTELLGDPVFIQRFEAEAKMAAQLEHPNIVRVYEVGEFQGTHYLAMEYVEGQSLAAILKSFGHLALPQALKIMRDVTAALDAAHRRGMIHRDIKPSNILVRRDGTVLLADFGLAKAVAASFAASLSSTSQIIGTLRYMAPEQAEQGKLDHRADIYALGVVLYEMLAGQPPFVGDTAIQLIRAHADKPPPPPSQFNKAITPAVESVMLRALAKDPAQRYPSAGHLAQALHRAARRDTEEKVPEPAPTKPEPQAKKEPVARDVAEERRPTPTPMPSEAQPGPSRPLRSQQVREEAVSRQPRRQPLEARRGPEPKATPKRRGLRIAVIGLLVLGCAIAVGLGAYFIEDIIDLFDTSSPEPTAVTQLERTVEEGEPTMILEDTPASPVEESLPEATLPSPTPTPTEVVPEPGGENGPADTPTPSPSPTPSATPTPSNTPVPPPSPPEPGDSRAVGESYEANGISVTLASYGIGSDGNVSLRFTVANQGTNKVLLRYQNSYFSVTDDTGKAYPQSERNLIDSKQAELAAGESFEIESDSYPDSYREIGYFSGKVPEQASRLIVRISQFADLQDMQWQIPLNARLSAAQSPNPGTQQSLLEGFSANGITVLLSDYSINSDGAIWFKFLVRNEGSNAVLLRYQNKYFEVHDDLDNRYEQDQRNLLDAKQVLLNPGESYEIEGDSYPDSYREIGYFRGMVPEQASALIIKVSQFADLRDMQWRIPLNAQLVRPQSPAPGTQQPLLEGFSANGITVLLSDYSINSDGAIWLKFLIRNEGSNAVLLRYQNKYFEVHDDLDNRYDQDQRNLLDAKQVLLGPGQSYEITSDSYPDSHREIGYFRGMVPEQASHLIVKLTQFADLRDLQWRIPLE